MTMTSSVVFGEQKDQKLEELAESWEFLDRELENFKRICEEMEKELLPSNEDGDKDDKIQQTPSPQPTNNDDNNHSSPSSSPSSSKVLENGFSPSPIAKKPPPPPVPAKPPIKPKPSIPPSSSKPTISPKPSLVQTNL